MAQHLATANMRLDDLLGMLGVSTPREIFYEGVGLTVLKSLAILGQTVNKLWLNPAYCPGADADARLANLRTARKLSYLKGYGYDDNVFLSPSYGMNFQSITMNPTPLDLVMPATTNKSGHVDYAAPQTITVNIGGTFLANRFISLIISSTNTEYARVAITNLGNHNISLPVGVSYPTSFTLSIVS